MTPRHYRSHRAACLLIVAALAATVFVVSAGPAAASPDVQNSLEMAGPSLSIPADQLAAALSCPDSLDDGERQPVLLVHGTSQDPATSWGGNYELALPADGFKTCTVHIPGGEFGDVQESSEYVVAAVREMARRSGKQIAVIGHSQANLEIRWALKWWPDVAADVDDYIGLSAPNQGAPFANHFYPVCATVGCPAWVWQTGQNTEFIQALNAAPATPPGVAITNIYSDFDEFVQPPSIAVLSGATNIRLQEACPGRLRWHGSMTWDSAVYRMVLDALTHAGAADLSRISDVCSGDIAPNMTNPVINTLSMYIGAVPVFFQTITAKPWVHQEPALAPYVVR